MSNAITCINKRVVVKNPGISFLAMIFNLSNPSTTILHAKKMVQVLEMQRVILSHTQCFWVDRYEPIMMAQWFRQVVVSRVIWLQFQYAG